MPKISQVYITKTRRWYPRNRRRYDRDGYNNARPPAMYMPKGATEAARGKGGTFIPGYTLWYRKFRRKSNDTVLCQILTLDNGLEFLI